MLYLSLQKNANERKESLLSICRVQLFFCKDTTFPRNFQGFREKILEKNGEKEKNRRLPELRAAYWLYYFYYDETDAYSTVQ